MNPSDIPMDTGRKLNVHKTFNLRPVSRGITTRGLSPLLLSNSDLWFFGPEFSYSPSSEWPNLRAGDNFTFPSTPNHNLVNDSCFNNVSACILCANSDNFNEASSALFETGNNVPDINNLVNPSARLISVSDAYDNLVDASTCLNSASTKVNVNISNVININLYSSLNKSLRITCWVMKAKAKFLGKINESKKESVTEEMIIGVDLSMASRSTKRFTEDQKLQKRMAIDDIR